jgi:hypothetical protein
MYLIDCFTWRYSNEKETSPFQLVIKPGEREEFRRHQIDRSFSIFFVNVEPPSKIGDFLNFHYDNYPGNKIDFIDCISSRSDWGKENDHPGTRIRMGKVLQWIETKRKELMAEVTEPGNPVKKIKWKGSPSVFGYLFLELVKKGFIDPPPYNGEPNFAELSRLCFQYFDINTTPENLKKALNEKSNQLSDTNRAKFRIPESSDFK